VAERQLLQRLVCEAVKMNEIRRYCTDTTQLGRVCSPSSYIYSCTASAELVKTYLTVDQLYSLHFSPRVGPEAVSMWVNV